MMDLGSKLAIVMGVSFSQAENVGMVCHLDVGSLSGRKFDE